MTERSAWQRVGLRVALHPATDAWMQGYKFGTITGISSKGIHVQLERMGATTSIKKWFHPSNVLPTNLLDETVSK